MKFFPHISTNTYFSTKKQGIDVLILDVHGSLGTKSCEMIEELQQLDQAFKAGQSHDSILQAYTDINSETYGGPFYAGDAALTLEWLRVVLLKNDPESVAHYLQRL